MRGDFRVCAPREAHKTTSVLSCHSAIHAYEEPMAATSGKNARWPRVWEDLQDVVALATRDFATLSMFVVVLKVGEFVLGLAFTESHPLVQAIRGFAWIPFFIFYLRLMYLDLKRLERTREERWRS